MQVQLDVDVGKTAATLEGLMDLKMCSTALLTCSAGTNSCVCLVVWFKQIHTSCGGGAMNSMFIGQFKLDSCDKMG